MYHLERRSKALVTHSTVVVRRPSSEAPHAPSPVRHPTRFAFEKRRTLSALNQPEDESPRPGVCNELHAVNANAVLGASSAEKPHVSEISLVATLAVERVS